MAPDSEGSSCAIGLLSTGKVVSPRFSAGFQVNNRGEGQFSPDAHYLALFERQLTIVDMLTGKTFEFKNGSPCEVAWASDNELVYQVEASPKNNCLGSLYRANERQPRIALPWFGFGGCASRSHTDLATDVRCDGGLGCTVHAVDVARQQERRLAASPQTGHGMHNAFQCARTGAATCITPSSAPEQVRQPAQRLPARQNSCGNLHNAFQRARTAVETCTTPSSAPEQLWQPVQRLPAR